MSERDERDVVVPAPKRAPLEVIEAQRVLELAVILRTVGSDFSKHLADSGP